MDLAARRPHISAGIALASAAVIAAAPMTQHLPHLDAAHYLPQVSVTDINLTDAASGMVDLFSGVENQLASLASGAAAAAVPAATVPAVNPIQTWINILPQALTNIESIGNQWAAVPFPLAQQIAANGFDYASLYVGAYQQAAKGAVNYFLGTNLKSDFLPNLATAWSDYLAGKISKSVSDLLSAFYSDPITHILLPLENILQLPGYFLKNLSNGYNLLDTFGLNEFGQWGITGLPIVTSIGLGTSLQNAYNAWNAGDTLAGLTQLLDTPGQTVNAFINGTNNSIGLLSAPTAGKPFSTGLVNEMLNKVVPQLAQAIVAPGAQNITQGGSLTTAAQNFVNQLINGWPSWSTITTDLSTIWSKYGPGLATQLTTMLQNIPSLVSNLPSMIGAFAGQIGTLLINLLKLL